MSKYKDNQERRFYIMATRNFNTTLPDNIKNQTVLAIKDEYTFNFMDLADNHSER